MRDKLKGKPPLDLYQAVREIACRLDEVIDYLNNNDPAFGDKYVRTFNGKTGDVVGVSSVNGQTGDVTVQTGGAVDSVNGKTGNVTITGDDISLNASDDQSISGVIDTLYGPDNVPPYPVTSVNSKTGAVELKGSDISVSDNNDESVASELAKKYDASNQPPYPVTSVNGQTGDVEISTGGGAVESVNGKTGAVLLTASDINATAGGTVQQNINTFSSGIEELGNEVNSLQQGVANLETEVDGKYSASNPPPYPVTSVNGGTGTVTVGYLQSGGVETLPYPSPTHPGISFRSASSTYPFNTIRASATQSGNLPVLEQIYHISASEDSLTQIYTAAYPQPITSSIGLNTGWLIKPNSGSYTSGVIVQRVEVTPDESGWITIPWPTGVNTIYYVLTATVSGGYPGVLYSITINTGTNIRAALGWGSSPWPNQTPIYVNLLLIAG